MNERLLEELAKLQDELSLLDAATKHIQNAGTIASEVVFSVQKLRERFDTAMQETLRAHELWLEKSSAHNNEAIEQIRDAHMQEIKAVNDLLASHKQLMQSSSLLIQKIEEANLDNRLKSMELNAGKTAAGMVQKTEALQLEIKRLENTVNTLTVAMQNSAEHQIEEFEKRLNTLQKDIATDFAALQAATKKQTKAANSTKSWVIALVFLLIIFFVWLVADFLDITSYFVNP